MRWQRWHGGNETRWQGLPELLRELAMVRQWPRGRNLEKIFPSVCVWIRADAAGKSQPGILSHELQPVWSQDIAQTFVNIAKTAFSPSTT